jgi:hypothetical protein
MLKILLILTSAFLFDTAANACPGTFAEYMVLIEGALPSAANDEMVVAKVQLIDDKFRSGTVRVVEAIKGVQVGDQFEIQAGSTTCSRLKRSVRYPEFQETFVSETYYIAGNWKNVAGKQVFFGEWRNGKKMGQ